jgi:hypothetical protein
MPQADNGDTVEILPQQPVEYPPTVHQVHRRPLGIGPVPLLGGLDALVLVLAIVLFVSGAWVGGAIVIALALALTGLLGAAIRRELDDPATRATLTAADRALTVTVRVRWRARFAAVTVRAWSRALLELAVLSTRRRRLRRQLDRYLGTLGEAVYRDDRQRAVTLKAQANDLERALQETEQGASEVFAATRQRVDRERTGIHATESFPIAEADPDPLTRSTPAGSAGAPR